MHRKYTGDRETYWVPHRGQVSRGFVLLLAYSRGYSKDDWSNQKRTKHELSRTNWEYIYMCMCTVIV